MRSIPDEEPVETLRPYRPDPALRVSVGSGGSRGRAENLHGLAPEHLIKRPGELTVPVPYQESHRASGLGALPSEIPRLLADPNTCGARRQTPEFPPPGPHFDEEEHVERLEPHRLDRQEVAGQDARGLLV